MGKHRANGEGEWSEDDLDRVYEEAVSDEDPEDED